MNQDHTILSVLRFAIFVEAGVAAILYLLHVPHRYFSECAAVDGVSTAPLDIICPSPAFAEAPHPLFFTVIDILVVTVAVYAMYAGFLYVRERAKRA